jgi:hypothetical protein
MSKIFSFMAKLHFNIYFLIGISLSFAILYNHVYPEVSLFLKEWGCFIVTSYMAVIVIEKIAMYNFYGRGQTIRKEIRDSHYLFVFSDLYFPKKINSGINGYKKAAGYIYVTFRVFNLIMLGIVIGVPIFYWLISNYA